MQNLSIIQLKLYVDATRHVNKRLKRNVVIVFELAVHSYFITVFKLLTLHIPKHVSGLAGGDRSELLQSYIFWCSTLGLKSAPH